MKSLAIMQPYFFPYIGYFQLISSVDEFVVYDNIKYTKKGWINRNRILVNHAPEYISLPLKKDSDFLNVMDRKLSDSWNTDRDKLLKKISSTYNKSPYYSEVMELVKNCIMFPNKNLFDFIFNSILEICSYISITTNIVTSSNIDIDHNLKSEDKVLAICKKQNANFYINAIGGIELYEKDHFESANIKLNFIKSNEIVYKQFGEIFVSNLSIVDVMMFNSKDIIKNFLNSYTLI